jgi:hypothetical protein
MTVTLKKQRILDTYAVLIENGQGGGNKFFDSVQSYLRNANMPNVTYEMVQVVTRRLFGGRGRDYLLVQHKFLSEFRMYICARDFGNYLDVTWALTLEPNILGRGVSKMITGSGQGLTFASLDLFAQQELDAYTVVVHRAVTDTAKGMFESMNQDFSKVNTRSRSGLAAW